MNQYKACADEIRQFELYRKVQADNQKVIDKIKVIQVGVDDCPFD